MFVYARHVLTFLMWHRPGEVLVGAALLGVSAVIATAGVSRLVGRRR